MSDFVIVQDSPLSRTVSVAEFFGENENGIVLYQTVFSGASLSRAEDFIRSMTPMP